jgi:uncharacterized protein (TIGR03546 family)
MLAILKLTRWLYNTFAGAMSPTQIAYGMCLGLFLVTMPFSWTSAQTLCVLGLVLVTRASVGLFSLTAALVKPIMMLGGDAVAWHLGKLLLEDTAALKSLWPKVLNLPVIALVDFPRYSVMGGFVLALLGSMVLFWPVRQGIVHFRTVIQPRADQYRLIRWWRGFWLTKLLSWIFVGGGESKPA